MSSAPGQDGHTNALSITGIGRRIFDRDTRRLVRPSPQSWESLWEQEPRFRRIWRANSIIWGSALIFDAVLRIAMAYLLPLNTVPALNGALWPVTFVVPQIVTNIQFARSGLWVILRDGATLGTDSVAQVVPVPLV